MSRYQLIFLHLANLAVAGTGLVYAWMRYLVEATDEWAVVNHPWQPHLQHLHVLLAPLLVFALGLIWSAHVIGKLKNGQGNRVVGIGLTTFFLPMAASGYFLQIAVSQSWRETWMWVHIVSSLLWVVAFVVHQLVALVAKRNRRTCEVVLAQGVTPFRVAASTRRAVEGEADTSDRAAWVRRAGD